MYPKAHSRESAGKQSEDDKDGGQDNDGGACSDDTASLVGIDIKVGFIQWRNVDGHGDGNIKLFSGSNDIEALAE